jgi:hypothetical protein
MGLARTVAFAGVSAAEMAELRQMVARAGELLDTPWSIGDAALADLVVCDPAQPDGAAAQARAGERGVACVAIDADDDMDLMLMRPFEIDGLMQLLVSAQSRLPERPAATAANVVGGAMQFGFGLGDAEPSGSVGVSLEAFFTADLIGLIPDAQPGEYSSSAPRWGAGPTDDALLAAVAALPASALSGAGSVPAAVERVAEPAAGSASTAPAPAAAPGSAPTATPEAAPVESRATPMPAPPAAPPRAVYPLLDYLQGALIGLPSRIVLAGAPPLVLDPASRAFHAAASLQELEPYLDTPLSRTQWTALLPSQLAAVRADIPARPYDLLRWYQALRQVPPGVPPGIDPSASYRLAEPLEIAGDHLRAARIVGAMDVPRGIGEIASRAGCSVTEVYAVLGAFAAIGRLEQHARPRTAVPGAAPRR